MYLYMYMWFILNYRRIIIAVWFSNKDILGEPVQSSTITVSNQLKCMELSMNLAK